MNSVATSTTSVILLTFPYLNGSKIFLTLKKKICLGNDFLKVNRLGCLFKKYLYILICKNRNVQMSTQAKTIFFTFLVSCSNKDILVWTQTHETFKEVHIFIGSYFTKKIHVLQLKIQTHCLLYGRNPRNHIFSFYYAESEFEK